MGSNDTKYLSLEETLKAAGKTVFVKFYYCFKDMRISQDQLAKKLYAENPKSKSERQGFRIPRARHIFETRQEIDALKLIIDSPKIDEATKRQAEKILQAELKSKSVHTDVEDENFLNELNNDIVYLEQENFEYNNFPKPPREMTTSISEKYPRNRAVSRRALFKANYLCECDNNHFVFKRRNSTINYTEPHHLVPLSAAKDFPEIDLDREQNVVSLCSSCHNLLHYGADFEGVLKLLYKKRKQLLKDIGVDIEFDELKKYY